MTRSGARGRVVAVAVVLVVVAVACSSSSGSNTSTPGPAVSRPSQPFTVGSVPTRYTLMSQAKGRQYNAWGDDSLGTSEPFMVLDSTGSNRPARVVVSVTGFQGYEGGLMQASPAGGPKVKYRRLRVDGHPAIFVPAQTVNEPAPARRFAWSDLLVRRGPDLAVRVRARGAMLQQLEPIARDVDPHGKTFAPTVRPVPGGYRSLGGVDVAAVAAAFPFEYPVSADPHRVGPGNPSVHHAEWNGPADAILSVVTVPSRTASVPALVGSSAFGNPSSRTKRVRVGDHAGVLVEERRDHPLRGVWRRVVYADMGNGNVVVVAAWRSPPRVQEMIAIAKSVKPTTAATWDRNTPDTPVPFSDPTRFQPER